MTAAPATTPVLAPKLGKQPNYLVPKYNKVEYSYDAVGNRVSMTTEAGTTHYSYNAGDQLIQAGETRYGYDANGNRITEDGPNGRVDYFYTSANRLSQVSFADGSFASYGYDALGRKVSRTELTYKPWAEGPAEEAAPEEGGETETPSEPSVPADGPGNSECAPGKTNGNGNGKGNGNGNGGNVLLNGNGNKYGLLKKLEHPLMPDFKADIEQTAYLYMGLSSAIHKEYSDKGSPYAEYVMGPNQSIVARKMFGLHGLANPSKEPSLDTNGGMLYYAYNGRHTVSELTDRHGDVIESYRYDAFGGITSGITAPYNTASYTGQHYDDVAGLMDMKARWYDPTAGRFLQQDTWPGMLDTPWTQNRYAYVGNNPINLWDPTGNVPEWVRNQESREEIRNGGLGISYRDYWTFNSYSATIYEPVLASSDRQLRKIVEQWQQTTTEEWNYTHSWDHLLFVVRDSGSETVTYSETLTETWTVEITGEQISAQNATMIRQQYGELPENAKPFLKVTMGPDGQGAAALLTSEDQVAAFTSVQQQILKSKVDEFLKPLEGGSKKGSVEILGFNGIKDLWNTVLDNKGVQLTAGFGKSIVDTVMDIAALHPSSPLYYSQTIPAAWEFAKALISEDGITLDDIKSGLEGEFIYPFEHLIDNYNRVFNGNPTREEAFNYGYNAGKVLQMILGAVSFGTGLAVKIASKAPKLAKLLGFEGMSNGLKFKAGFDKHLIEVEDVVRKGNKGIVGGHNLENFEKAFTDRGWSLDENIISKTTHPTVSGIYEIKYQIPAVDTKGNIIPGQYKNIPNPKTVYDPSVISNEQMLQWGQEAMKKGIINGRIVTGTASNGLKFQGYIENGEITNFFPTLK
ncbi:MAG TPA: RHS repeat-associated core domain-containing protein [Paenibacillus sp.]|nr:RHS repeat-associated core domain-containing protein [Paenibacillus sp.]